MVKRMDRASLDQRSKRSECRRSSPPSSASSGRKRVNSWTTWVRSTAGSLRSSRHGRKVGRWHHSGRGRLRAQARELAESWRGEARCASRSCPSATPASSMSRRRVSEKLVIRNSLVCQNWWTAFVSAALATWSRRRRKRRKKKEEKEKNKENGRRKKESLWSSRP